MKSTSAKFLIGIVLFIFAGFLGYKLFPSPNSQDQVRIAQKSKPVQVQVEPSVRALPERRPIEVPAKPIEEEKPEPEEEVTPPTPDPVSYTHLTLPTTPYV